MVSFLHGKFRFERRTFLPPSVIVAKISCTTLPTNPFTILELQNPLYGVLELDKISQSPGYEALKL